METGGVSARVRFDAQVEGRLVGSMSKVIAGVGEPSMGMDR